MVNTNGRRTGPTRPPIIAMGKSTTTLVAALANTGIQASAAPRRAASAGDWPASRCETMASSTTIELVTRMPTDMPMAIRVDMFNV